VTIISAVGDASAQAEYESALRDAIRDSPAVDFRCVERFLVHLESAVQAHRPWADLVLGAASRVGLNAILREEFANITSAEDAALFSYKGELVSVSLRRGRRKKDVVTNKLFWQQALFDDFSWAELAEWLAMINSQIGAALINQEMGERLLGLRSKYPDSYGPMDACLRDGTTLRDYLEQEPKAA
jgi:hypothetical protein